MKSLKATLMLAVFTQTCMCLLFKSKSAKIRDQLDKLRGNFSLRHICCYYLSLFLSHAHRWTLSSIYINIYLYIHTYTFKDTTHRFPIVVIHQRVTAHSRDRVGAIHDSFYNWSGPDMLQQRTRLPLYTCIQTAQKGLIILPVLASTHDPLRRNLCKAGPYHSALGMRGWLSEGSGSHGTVLP